MHHISVISVSLLLPLCFGFEASAAKFPPCGEPSFTEAHVERKTGMPMKPKATRRLTFAELPGSLKGKKRRVWNTRLEHNEDRADLILKYVKGSGEMAVTVCAHTFKKNGKSTAQVLERFVFSKKTSKGKVTKRLRGLNNKFISLHVKGLSKKTKLDYRVRLRRPQQGRVDPRPRFKKNVASVKGFADLHVHQMVELAHGGIIFGDHRKGKLEPCPGKHKTGTPFRNVFPNHLTHPTKTKPHDWWPHTEEGFHQMVDYDSLKLAWESGLRLMVNTAVGSQAGCYLSSTEKLRYQRARELDIFGPPLLCDDMDSVRRQLQAAITFAEKHDWYEIARDPAHAREIIKDKRLAVVLAVEVSNLFPEHHGDWRQQFNELYSMGVRSLEIAHHTDSDFSGSAHQQGAIFQILNSLKKLSWGKIELSTRRHKYCKEGEDKGVACNRKGLSKQGKALVKLMMERHMIIPLDHVSRTARREIYELSKKNNYYPLNATHSRFDEILTKKPSSTHEYMMSDSNAKWIRKTGGVFGIITGPNATEQICTPGQPIDCPGSAESLAQNLCYADKLGLAMSLGSDASTGFISNMTGPRWNSTSPKVLGVKKKSAAKKLRYKVKGKTVSLAACPGLSTAEKLKRAKKNAKWNRTEAHSYKVRGFSSMRYAKPLIDDMLVFAKRKNGKIQRSAESFLRMWERAYDDKKRRELSKKAYRKYMGL